MDSDGRDPAPSGVDIRHECHLRDAGSRKRVPGRRRIRLSQITVSFDNQFLILFRECSLSLRDLRSQITNCGFVFTKPNFQGFLLPVYCAAAYQQGGNKSNDLKIHSTDHWDGVVRLSEDAITGPYRM
jgi:hypothetical protein